MKWIRYCEIENSYREAYIEQIKEFDCLRNPSGLWHITEKVDGANLSLAFDKDSNFTIHTKSQEVTGEHTFYTAYETTVVLKDKMETIFNFCAKNYEDIDTVIVYGEYAGGVYKSPDVDRDKTAMKCQGRISYSPSNFFIAFDIRVVKSDGTDEFLASSVVSRIFASIDFMFLPVIFTGTLEECLNYPCAFKSALPSMFNLPDIENNICEGVVLRPDTEYCLNNGKRAIIKHKNEQFKETRKVSIPVESEEYPLLAYEMLEYVTENRLRNVLSHIGPVTPKDFNLIMREFSIDVTKDFERDKNKSLEEMLDLKERKAVIKIVQREICNILKNNMLNIVDGVF